MITFAPLWRTMKEKGVSTYTLREKCGMSHATVQRLQRNMPVSTITMNRLCEILDCPLSDIAGYVKE